MLTAVVSRRLETRRTCGVLLDDGHDFDFFDLIGGGATHDDHVLMQAGQQAMEEAWVLEVAQRFPLFGSGLQAGPGRAGYAGGDEGV